MTGWTICTDDDGAPDELIADFKYRADAEFFAQAKDHIEALRSALLDLVVFSGSYLEAKAYDPGSMEADVLRASRKQAQFLLKLL
jgi:hypothetical protein